MSEKLDQPRNDLYDIGVTPQLVLLAIVVITALAFDFTNGFHDTANAMATSIATKALTPKAAVSLCAALNLVGAFLSVEVAITVTNAVIRIQDANGAPKPELLADGGFPLLLILISGLAGAIIWNILTWLWGLPSSSSHALFGGLVGSTVMSLGWSGVKWIGEGNHLDGIVGKVVLPALFSPVIACLVAAIGTRLVYRITEKVAARYLDVGFRRAQVGTAALLSLSHGTNDAQKTMGVITLALVATQHWNLDDGIPFWVKVACAFTIALGTFIGGWRIIRTMGKGLVEISPPQGFTADSSSAAVILISSQLGFALSTTHVATGSILGTGLGRKGASVRWSVAGRMGIAWLITLPLSGMVGAICWILGHWVGLWAGQTVGAFAVTLVLVLAAGYMYMHSRRNAVGHHNIHDDWDSPASVGDSAQIGVAAAEVVEDFDHIGRPASEAITPTDDIGHPAAEILGDSGESGGDT
ncbi:MAG: inorganic phosphate transporter [Propionibacteriaceae bacterium]|nr:inorganic phosphate transporter [Propionibacteriaceae bacterium]